VTRNKTQGKWLSSTRTHQTDCKSDGNGLPVPWRTRSSWERKPHLSILLIETG